MGQTDVDLACRQLILGQNKVCGLTTPEAAQAAYQVGAVHGGLIFVGKSPRCVDIPQAKTVMAGAPLRYVGVFQNAELDTVLQTVRQLGLAAVQLHGQEDAAYINALRSALPEGCQIWKAIAIGEQLPRHALQELANQVDRILLDTQVGQQSGGTGQAFDWTLLDELDKTQLMLAGGINPDNAQSASQVGCLGLDLNSGVESAPGIKDADKLQRAFTALRAY